MPLLPVGDFTFAPAIRRAARCGRSRSVAQDTTRTEGSRLAPAHGLYGPADTSCSNFVQSLLPCSILADAGGRSFAQKLKRNISRIHLTCTRISTDAKRNTHLVFVQPHRAIILQTT